jgi:hypothetical protein
MKVVRG